MPVTFVAFLKNSLNTEHGKEFSMALAPKVENAAKANNAIKLMEDVFSGFPVAMLAHFGLPFHPSANQQLSADYNELLLAKNIKLHYKLPSFLRQLVAIACTECLDEFGGIKPELVALLKLESVLAIQQSNPEYHFSIDVQFVLSYLKSILLATLDLNWRKNHNHQQQLSDRIDPSALIDHIATKLLAEVENVNSSRIPYSPLTKKLMKEAIPLAQANLKQSQNLALPLLVKRSITVIPTSFISTLHAKMIAVLTEQRNNASTGQKIKDAAVSVTAKIIKPKNPTIPVKESFDDTMDILFSSYFENMIDSVIEKLRMSLQSEINARAEALVRGRINDFRLCGDVGVDGFDTKNLYLPQYLKNLRLKSPEPNAKLRLANVFSDLPTYFLDPKIKEYWDKTLLAKLMTYFKALVADQTFGSADRTNQDRFVRKLILISYSEILTENGAMKVEITDRVYFPDTLVDYRPIFIAAYMRQILLILAITWIKENPHYQTQLTATSQQANLLIKALQQIETLLVPGLDVLRSLTGFPLDGHADRVAAFAMRFPPDPNHFSIAKVIQHLIVHLEKINILNLQIIKYLEKDHSFYSDSIKATVLALKQSHANYASHSATFNTFDACKINASSSENFAVIPFFESTRAELRERLKAFSKEFSADPIIITPKYFSDATTKFETTKQEMVIIYNNYKSGASIIISNIAKWLNGITQLQALKAQLDNIDQLIAATNTAADAANNNAAAYSNTYKNTAEIFKCVLDARVHEENLASLANQQEQLDSANQQLNIALDRLKNLSDGFKRAPFETLMATDVPTLATEIAGIAADLKTPKNIINQRAARIVNILEPHLALRNAALPNLNHVLTLLNFILTKNPSFAEQQVGSRGKEVTVDGITFRTASRYYYMIEKFKQFTEEQNPYPDLKLKMELDAYNARKHKNVWFFRQATNKLFMRSTHSKTLNRIIDKLLQTNALYNSHHTNIILKELVDFIGVMDKATPAVRFLEKFKIQHPAIIPDAPAPDMIPQQHPLRRARNAAS